jgi:hypothetical protein
VTISQSTLDVAQWLLNTTHKALDDCGRDPISRAYVAAGEIAWDDCCGMLVVAPERVYRSVSFPAEASEEELCFGGYIAVEYVVLVVRCVPTVDDRGRAPTAVALQQAYDSLLGDAAVVFNAVASDMPDYWMRTSPTQSFVGANGGCIGVETRITVGAEQDIWGICCTEPAPHTIGDPICKIPAGRVTFEPCEGLTSTNVQDAICELASQETPTVVDAVRGQIASQTAQTIQIASANTYVPMSISGSFDTAIALGTQSSTTASFGVKNTSGQSLVFMVIATVDVSIGNNRVAGLRLAVDGVPIAETTCHAATGTQNFAKLLSQYLINVPNNSEVSCFLANIGATSNIGVERAKIVAHAVGVGV